MKEIGIYVHIPFCLKKCKYCDFVSYDKKDEECQKKYIESLIKTIDNISCYLNMNSNLTFNLSSNVNQCLELKQNLNLNQDLEGNIDFNDLIVNTIYFGGGTPSYISSKYILEILDKIKSKFNIKEDAEITIEVNPGTVNKEKFLDYYNSGINRISIGLQSTKNNILKTIGRIHSFEEFIEAYNLIKEVGFKNINIDLMLALPNQTLNDLEESLKKVIELEPNHISLYSLILEENTELEKEIYNGSLKLPSDEIERKMYHITKNILECNNYVHYEISNFAKKGAESKHNLNCWNQKEYLGFGLASHSYINKIRFSNITNLKRYIDNIENDDYAKNIEIQEIQTKKEDIMKEYMMLGFRKINGISISEFEQKFNINPLFYFRFEICKLEEEGLIEVDLDNIVLTKKGLDFANKVFEEFI